mgnify:CR=1 FL=1
MAELATIARPYAEALFKALDADQDGSISESEKSDFDSALQDRMSTMQLMAQIAGQDEDQASASGAQQMGPPPGPPPPEPPAEVEHAPSFGRSERRWLLPAFVILLPFLLIDLVVASILLALGMMMVPPATISLPIKVLMFVLIDGWSLVM